MEVMDAVLGRRSIRKYKDIPIPKDVLIDICISAQYAPHSGNAHTARLFVIDEEDVKDSISDACYHQSWMKSAPIFIVVSSDLGRIEKMYGKRGANLYSNQNSAAIAENMALTAFNHGVSSCWVSAFNEELVAQILNLPDDIVPQVVMTFGYSAEKVPTPVKQNLSTLIYLNRYGGAGRFNNLDMLFRNYSDHLRKHLSRSAKTVSTSGKFIGKKWHEQIKKKSSELKDKFKK